MTMPEAIAQLCQIIAQKLQTQPEISQAELMQHVEAAIAVVLLPWS
ncbi:hypothetical protein NDA01_23260 [Trichocoleus desertorum AS-A10]